MPVRLLCLCLCCWIAAASLPASAETPVFSFAESHAPDAGARPAPADPADLEEEALALFRSSRLYGAALIVTRNGQPLLRTAYGLRDHQGNPVTLDTRFRSASVTKLAAAVGLMTLYDEGRFDLDAPLTAILPFRAVNPQYPEIPVTPRQTLSHTSSVISATRYHPNWEILPKENRYFRPDTEPGSEYHYANLNGGLTGSMIEALSGQSLNTFMTERLFGPLGIDAAFNAGLLRDQTDISEMILPDGQKHASVKKQINTIRDYNDTCDPRRNTDVSVGSLYISAEGLSRIAQMLAAGGVWEGRRILKEETVRLMERDQSSLPGSSVRCESPYGLGMARVTDVGAHPWYGHQGRYLGLVSNLYYQPATGLTFAFIATGYDGVSENGLSNLSRKLLAWVEGAVSGNE